MIRTFQWFRHHEIPDALRLGWIIARPNGPMHHHDYSFLCEWLCDCPPVRPRRDA